ncbi:MAG TPA: peroxiredoxin-like family protein [Acidimicrobiales bacterium]|jgi:peroxiredoxin|nr:peroxiredoxin-like family protein [Acidimicrobiales bacterium]
MTMTISEQVGAMRAGQPPRPEGTPPNPFEAEQARLAVNGIPSGVMAVGSTLENVDLLDPKGASTTLYAATSGERAVLVFYRGVWCPFCNIALRTYQAELLPELTKRGIRLIAISPQKPDGSLSMAEKDELTFAVLSDPGNHLAGALGILTAPSPDALAAQLAHGMDLTAVNADGTTALPMPTTVIVAGDGTVQWIDVHPDYTTRSEPAEILAAL